MNFILRFFVFALIVVLFSCEQGDTGLKTSPVSGYQYEVYSTDNGVQVKEGEYVYFQMEVLDDKGEVLQSYRNQKQMPSVKIPPATDQVRQQNPVVDVLSNLAIGDSVGVIIPSDSIPNLPVGYEEVKSFFYVLTVKDILNESDNQAKVSKIQEEEMVQMTALKERLPEVETLANKTLNEYKAGKLADVKETATGLKYVIHELGTGDLPSKDAMLLMQYYGALVTTNKMFDNSFSRGRGYPFRVGAREVIGGWDEAALLLPVGTKASLFIPSDLGYGDRGNPPTIPGGAELYFYVEAEELFY